MADKMIRLTREQIEAIEASIRREERIEIIPTKKGPAVFRVKRQEIKTERTVSENR